MQQVPPSRSACMHRTHPLTHPTMTLTLPDRYAWVLLMGVGTGWVTFCVSHAVPAAPMRPMPFPTHLCHHWCAATQDPYNYFSLSSSLTFLMLQLHPFSPTPSCCQSPPPTWLPVSVGAHGRTKAGNIPQVCLHPMVSHCGPRSGSQAARRHACTRAAHR